MLCKSLFTACLSTAVMLSTISAEASFMLRLTDLSSNTTGTVADQGPGDFSPLPGKILFNGTVGAFDFGIESGTSKPLVGTTNMPVMLLVAVVTSNIPGSTLMIELTDSGFGPSADPLPFMSVINSASPVTQSTTYETYIDTSNTPFGRATPLSSLGPHSGIFDDSDLAFASTTPSPYSLTLVSTVTHGSGILNSQFDASLVAIPEPATIAIWGGLFCVAIAVGNRGNRKSNAELTC